jgi:nucleotide-binding universal stress UspA family protein
MEMEFCRTHVALRNVLFATDFSKESAQAVNALRSLCTGYGVRLYVAHVADVFPFPIADNPSARERVAGICKDAETRLRDFMRSLGFDGSDFEAAILAGELPDVVNQFIQCHHIDLVVLGSSGSMGFARLFDGSAAEEIFRSAKCPVITVGPHATRSTKDDIFANILFPTDLSMHSRIALPYIEWLLSRYSGSQLTLLHVLPRVGHPLQQQLAAPAIEADVLALISADLRDRVKSVIVTTGEPASVIIATAAEMGSDLLVLGVRYGGSFLRVTTHSLCSLAPAIVAKSPCPVLTIRSYESSAESDH